MLFVTVIFVFAPQPHRFLLTFITLAVFRLSPCEMTKVPDD